MSAHPAGPRHGEPVALQGAPGRPASTAAALRLDPKVWPQDARRNADGAIELAGVDVRDVAAEVSTPTVVLDERHVRQAARGYAEAYEAAAGHADVYYAGKAFLATTVVEWLIAEGLRIDVCTMGELEVALRGGAEEDFLH